MLIYSNIAPAITELSNESQSTWDVSCWLRFHALCFWLVLVHFCDFIQRGVIALQQDGGRRGMSNGLLTPDAFLSFVAMAQHHLEVWEQACHANVSMSNLFCTTFPVTHCSQISYRQLRARRALMLFKDVPLRTRRALMQFKDVPLRTRRALMLFKDVPLRTRRALMLFKDVPLRTRRH